MLAFVLPNSGIELVLLCRLESVPLYRVSLFILSQLGLSCCIESVLFCWSRVIPRVLPRISLFCFVFVFSLSFEPVSTVEPVTPEDLNETAVVFMLLCLFLL